MPTREPRPETRLITEEGKAACVAFFVLHREGLKDRLPVDGELTKWIEYNKLVRTHKLNRSQVKLQFTKWRSGVAQDQGRGPRQGDKALRASLSKRLESCEGGLKQIFKNVTTKTAGSYLVAEGLEPMRQLLMGLVCSEAALQYWQGRIHGFLDTLVKVFPQSQSKIARSATLLASELERTRIQNMPKFMEQGFVKSEFDRWY